MSAKVGYRQTEIGEVPKEWEVKTIDKICEKPEYGYTQSATQKPVGPKFLRITDIQGGFVNWNSVPYCECPPDIVEKHLLKSGDILFARTGATTGKSYLVTECPQAVFASYLIRVRAKEKEVDPNFLFHFFNSQFYWKQVKQSIVGSAQGGMNASLLARLNAQVPPLPEQQKIASILSTVDDTIQKTDGIISATQQLKKGLMQQLLTKGIGHTKFKQTEIGKIPEEWGVVELGRILQLCQYGLSVPLHESGKVPIFRMNNFEEGQVVPSDLKYVDIDSEVFNQFKLEKGDLLFNRTNSYDLVGKVGIFQLDGDYTFASYLIRLRPSSESADPFFVNYFLNTERSQKHLKSLATRGVSQTNINATNLKTIVVPLPPLSEQKKIASIISSAQDKISKEMQKREQFKQIKKGLMQDLLAGKVRVKVN
jgi:type I restriction enzyme S subunit